LKDAAGNALNSVQVSGVCASGSSWNGGSCAASGTGNEGSGTGPTSSAIDLTVGKVTPTTAKAGSPTTFTATVSNIGGASTSSGFKGFFQVHFISLIDSTDLINEPAQDMGSLLAGGMANVSFSYTPTPNTAATQYIRFCADKSTQNDTGTITESNEENNCGYWQAIAVAQPAGGGGDVSNTQSCHLSAAKNSDGSYKLSWTFTGGSDFLININGAGTFYSAGSTTVNPSGTVTYTGNIQKAVDFSPPPIYGTCSVTVTGTGSTGDGGGGGPSSGGSPDLTAGSISPTVALANAATIFSAAISNIGGASSGVGSITTFQKATDSSGTGAAKIGSANTTAVSAGGSANASLSYTFAAPGTYYLRACADQGVTSGGATPPPSGTGAFSTVPPQCMGAGAVANIGLNWQKSTTRNWLPNFPSESISDATNYQKSYTYPVSAALLPWPTLSSGGKPVFSISNNSYLAMGFTVPQSASGYAAKYFNVGSLAPLAAFSISECPGDFGQAGTHITNQYCKSDRVGGNAGGLGAYVGTATGNCSLQVGKTYYLNVAHIDVPAVGSTANTQSVCLSGTCQSQQAQLEMTGGPVSGNSNLPDITSSFVTPTEATTLAVGGVLYVKTTVSNSGTVAVTAPYSYGFEISSHSDGSDPTIVNNPRANQFTTNIDPGGSITSVLKSYTLQNPVTF
jgi:hypothetical protein